MQIKKYDSLTSTIRFYRLEKNVCFLYRNNLKICNKENLFELKNNIELPYKISFFGLSRSMIDIIINNIKTDNSNLFCYRFQNPISNELTYYAIFTEKVKIKKL